MTDRIAVGVIRKPHGIRGEASVEAWTDSLDRFNDLSAVTLVSPDETSTREAEVESIRIHSGRALVKFRGINSPEELREFHGWTVEIPESEARALDAGEYFLHDLIGLTLIDEEGRERGTVRDAFEGGGGVLLTVRNGVREFDVPFAAAICKEIDLQRKQIVVDLPAGLEELQALPALENETTAVESDDRDEVDERSASGGPSAAEVAGPDSPVAPTRAPAPAIRIDFLTIFPKMFEPLLAEGVIARGTKQGLLDIRVWDLRDYATDKHRSTDDEAYGGGPGMVMLAEPILRCVDAIVASGSDSSSATVDAAERRPHIVMTTPQGRPLTQQIARDLAGDKWIVILCGRYEGFDHRVHEALAPDEISVGDFVVSGGELPAMLIADAVGRMIEGVVGNSGSVEEDSFFHGLLDYPHYTRPEELRGMRIPDILMSGHHEKIRRWRKEQALRATLAKRPDLLEKAELDDESRRILADIAPDSEWAKNAPAAERKRGKGDT
jgi:tRNA (guanine37-N1)-methyltransferase